MYQEPTVSAEFHMLDMKLVAMDTIHSKKKSMLKTR